MSEDRTFIMNATKDAQLQDHFVLWIDSNQAYALMRLLLNRIENNEDKFSISFVGEVKGPQKEVKSGGGSSLSHVSAKWLEDRADKDRFYYAPADATPNGTFSMCLKEGYIEYIDGGRGHGNKPEYPYRITEQGHKRLTAYYEDIKESRIAPPTRILGMVENYLENRTYPYTTGKERSEYGVLHVAALCGLAIETPSEHFPDKYIDFNITEFGRKCIKNHRFNEATMVVVNGGAE